MTRQRLMEHELARKFFDRVLSEAIGEGLVSEDHFTLDGTLIRSMASLSQRVRKRIEQIIGWMKTTGTQARTRFIGHGCIELDAHMTAAAYNLLAAPMTPDHQLTSIPPQLAGR